MALATRCPACSTVFRISTAQAAAKGGMVRCGQCRNVFNSLDALVRVEDLEIVEEAIIEPRPSSVATPAVEAAADHLPADADPAASLAPVEAIETVHARIVREPFEAAADESHAGVDDAVVRAWWVPEHEVPFPPRPLASGESSMNAPSLTTASPGSPASTGSKAIGPRDDAGRVLSGIRGEGQPGAALDALDATFMQADRRSQPLGRAARWTFGVLSVVAVIGLLGQAAFLWRDELAVRWAPARSWLAAGCAPLQCKVDYPTHLDAITIESASIQTSVANPGSYLLTALLRNRAAIDLRYPYLELVLTDVQDRPILRRALRPEDYLMPAPEAGFAAQSELPIRLAFDLTDLRFAGYRLDRFYP